MGKATEWMLHMAAWRWKARIVAPHSAPPASLGMLVCILSMMLGALPATAQTGFINIDCGSSVGNFEEGITLTFEADNYISTGTVVDNVPYTGRLIELSSFRTFPKASTPTKNCYEVHVLANNQYHVKAIFYYGNYTPTPTPTIDFQLALESTVWTDMSIDSTETSFYYKAEAIYYTLKPTLSVCLIRTLDTSDPFISGLQLVLLPRRIYLYRFKSPASNWLHAVTRSNFGHSGTDTRYPDDVYDRVWFPQDGFANYAQLPGIPGQKYFFNDSVLTPDLPPDKVLQTAMTDESQINFTYSIAESAINQFPRFYVSFLIAEVTDLAPGTRRVMDLSGNFFSGPVTVDTLVGTPFSIYYLTYSYQPLDNGGVNFVVTFNSTSTPGLGPILNAFELYGIGDVNSSTRATEVAALAAVKTALGIANWSGNPCFPVPWQLVKCTDDRVTSIDLSGQYISGGIPDFSALTALTYLDLSNNDFTGPLPDWVGGLPALKTLDVSNNQLNGTFPSTYLTSIPGFNYTNNLQLTCKQVGDTVCPVSGPAPPPLSSTPGSASAPPPQSSTSSSNSKKSSSAGPIIGGVVGGILLLTFLILSLLFCCFWYKPRKFRINLWSPPSPMMDVDSSRAENHPHMPGMRGKAKPFTLLDVREATNNFARKIGEGGFGPVYFSLLPNGQEVAVKVMSGRSQQGFLEFTSEIDLLSTVHYKKLVSLVGYCQEGKDLMLLYEYMSGGDLRHRLRGPKASYFPLNSRQRLQIALDVAHGLDYLHQGCNPAIFHRDVKSGNILLTEKLEAKVADFGLSKLLGVEQTHVMTMVKGTLEYLDPEYNTTGMLTDKSDVYSFGVLLLELLSGQPPISKEGPTSKFCVDKVRASMNTGNLQAMVDPGLRGEYKMESAWKLADVAMSCVALPANSRPAMSRVVAELGQVLEFKFGSQASVNAGWASSDSGSQTSNSYSKASALPADALSQIFHEDVRPR